MVYFLVRRQHVLQLYTSPHSYSMAITVQSAPTGQLSYWGEVSSNEERAGSARIWTSVGGVTQETSIFKSGISLSSASWSSGHA